MLDGVKLWMGKSLYRLAATAFESASTTRRNKGFRPSRVSGTRAVITNGDEMRARARHLRRNNPWADNGIEAWVANCIGRGITPRSTVVDTGLRDDIHALWADWAAFADPSGVLDFAGLQALAVASLVESGEVFARLLMQRADKSMRVPLHVEMIEADQVPLTINRLEGRNRIIAGIEHGPRGKRVAYHVYKDHPGDPLGAFNEISRVSADRMLHVYRPDRPGQVRGASWFAPALQKLLDLDVYDDAELKRKQTTALFAAFIRKKADGEAPVLGADQSNIAGPMEGVEQEVGLEPGGMAVLEAGEDIAFSQPSDVGGSYQTFMNTQLRAIAAGLGITFEQLTGDLSDVNFSSIRAGIIEFRRRCQQVQTQIINHQFNRPVWREFIRQAVLAGALPQNRAQDMMREVKWIPHGFEFVQPVQEQMAHTMMVRGGFKTRSQVVSELGGDPEEVERAFAADNERADEAGLVFDTDPRRVAKSGVGQDLGSLVAAQAAEKEA